MHTLRKKKVLPSTFLGAQLVSRVWAPCTRYSTLQNVQHLAQGAEVHKVHKVQHLARGAAPCTRCSTLHEVQHLARGAAPCTRCSTLHEVQHLAQSAAPCTRCRCRCKEIVYSSSLSRWNPIFLSSSFQVLFWPSRC